MTSVDAPAVEGLFSRPIEFQEAAVKRLAIIARVAFALDLGTNDCRQPIRHLRRADEIAAAERDAIELQVVRYEIEQPLAEEVCLEASRAAIGAGGCLV